MILVVGANGYLGRALMRAAETLAMDVCGASHTEGTEYRLDLLQDIRSPIDNLSASIDHAIICSSYTSIDGCRENPNHARTINVTGTLDLIRALISRNIRPVYCSTDMVFGGSQGGYGEEDLAEPATIYGSQKREVETWLKENLTSALIVRMTKLYDMGKEDRSFLKQIYQNIAESRPVKAATDQIVQPTLVSEAATGILGLIKVRADGIFHIAAPEALSWFDVACKIQSSMGVQGMVEAASVRDFEFIEPRAAFSTLDASKFQSAIGFQLSGLSQALPNLIPSASRLPKSP